MYRFQFPKDFFEWIEAHQGTAAWMQALGAVLTVGIAIWISRRDIRRVQQAERRRATGLAVLLHTEMVDLRHRITRAIASVTLTERRVTLPESLGQHSADLYLLGRAGGFLLQMISTLRAHNRQVDEMERLGEIDLELWNGLERNLEMIASACDEAIAGMDKIIEASAPLIKGTALQAILRFFGRRPSA
jgi:hypothetical protein